MPPPPILIVDDNDDLRSVAAAILRAEGYTVDHCADLQDAIRLARRKTYGSIVCEPSPAAGYASLLRYLSGEPRALGNVVAATTEDDPGALARLAGAGVFCILRKPYSRRSLTDVVRACCART